MISLLARALLTGVSRIAGTANPADREAVRRAIAEVVQSSDEPRLGRRRLLGRAALGLPMAAFLPVFASWWGTARGGHRSTNAPTQAAQGAGYVCYQSYALCTSAPCVLSPANPNISVCRCFVENGPSFGNTSCEQRARVGNTLYSAFSLQNITGSSTFMTCPESAPWANCLDVVCTVDPAHPMQALCQCQMTQSANFITFGGDCDLSTCTSVIWSAASADMIEQAVATYTAAVHDKGSPVRLPAMCP